MPETATDLTRPPRAGKLGVAWTSTAAERARHALTMRQKRARIKKEQSGFGTFESICAEIGLRVSPGSCLDPRLWYRVVQPYEGLDITRVKVSNEEFYKGNDHLFVPQLRLSSDSGVGWDRDPELRSSRARVESDRLLRPAGMSYYDRLVRTAA